MFGWTMSLLTLSVLKSESIRILLYSEQLANIIVIIRIYLDKLPRLLIICESRSLVILHTGFHRALFSNRICLKYYMVANLFDTLSSSLFNHYLQLTILDGFSAQNQLLFIQLFCRDSFVNLWPRTFILIYHIDLRYIIDHINFRYLVDNTLPIGDLISPSFILSLFTLLFLFIFAFLFFFLHYLLQLFQFILLSLYFRLLVFHLFLFIFDGFFFKLDLVLQFLPFFFFIAAVLYGFVELVEELGTYHGKPCILVLQFSLFLIRFILLFYDLIKIFLKLRLNLFILNFLILFLLLQVFDLICVHFQFILLSLNYGFLILFQLKVAHSGVTEIANSLRSGICFR